MEELRRRLRKMKMDKGINYNWIAEKCHIKQSTLSHFLKGDRNISINNCEKLDKLLKEYSI